MPLDLSTLLGGKNISPTKFQELTRALYSKNVELSEQKKRIEFILNTISEGIIDTDDKFSIKLMNQSARLILFGSKEVPEDLYQDKNFFDTFTFQDKNGMPISKEELVKIKSYINDNYLTVKSGNTIKSIYLRINTIIGDGTQIPTYLVAINDITSEKELEKTKDDFISVTSHELRTPMTIVKSYLWMLGNEKKGTLNDKQKEYLDKAARGAERMLNLINDTLSISRIEQGRVEFKMDNVNLREIIDDVSSDFKIKTDEKNIWLKVEYDSSFGIEPIIVEADKNKLREVVTNYLGNSIKFTKEGGITVKVEPTINNMLKVSVTDTGRGIAPEDTEKLFHKFGRLDNSYQTVAESGGTGLGLYIVKSLVEKMGGTIGVFSEGLNKGSTFSFTLKRNPLI